jgi:superfamily I DNA/RNA helicase
MDAVKQPIRAPSIKRGEKIIIDANAGSGKTTALIGVMAVAIRQWGLRTKCLLAITYARAMARELTGSLAARGLTGVSTSTLHALGRRLIKEDPQRFGLTANFTVLNSETSYLKRQYQRYFGATLPIPPGLLVRAFHARFQQDIRVGEFLRNQRISQAKIDQVIAFLNHYVKTKKEEGNIGFHDMIALVHQQLKADPDYLAALVSRFQLLAVDEYQDLNAQERALVQLLAKHIETVLIAGDDLQAIHVYRGASTTALEELEEQFPDARVISLKQSWRLTHENAAFVNAVLADNGQAKRITGTGHGPQPRVIANNSRHGMYQRATQTILQLMAEGVQPEEIAVLARFNKSTLTLALYLEGQGIPFILTHDLDRRHKLLLRFRRFLQAVLGDPPEALRLLLQWEVRLDEETAAQLTDLAARIPAQRLGLSAEQHKTARKFRQAVAITRAAPRVDRALPVFATDFQGHQDRYNLTPIQHVLRLEGIAYDATTTLQELHDRVNDHLESRDTPQQGVTLSTIHAVKGGERRYVLVLDIYDENLSRNGELPVDEAAEFRVFHVALTRVKHQMYLFTLQHEADEDARSRHREGQPNVIDIAPVNKQEYATLRFLPPYPDVKDLCRYERAEPITLDQKDPLSPPQQAAPATPRTRQTARTARVRRSQPL